ncbi:unnamed protein product [Meganyctiphanes norvegica]|uniref:CHK kinase-like domain-containing protein n=1 Tax=Meganyctiphanes norvegica TaxID=48144 RepID=A0AAV2Q9D4_MEGNR
MIEPSTPVQKYLRACQASTVLDKGNIQIQSSPAEKYIVTHHIEAALASDKGSDAKLNSWKIVDFVEKGDNFGSLITSVLVNYKLLNIECKVSYIVKIIPNQYIKEIKFYTEVLPLLNSSLKSVWQPALRIPKCIHVSSEEQIALMILEDLRPRGFKMFERKKGLDIQHTKLALAELARLHASSIILHRNINEILSDKFDFLKATTTVEDEMKTIFQGNVTTAIMMLDKIGGYKNVISWLKNILPTVDEIYTSSIAPAPPFEVLCHGDCWNNNLLFRYDDSGQPVEVQLVDLQASFVSSPAVDINYLLYTSLSGDVRNGNISSFLSIYHNAFKKVLKAAETKIPFTKVELLQEFRKRNIFGLLMGMNIACSIVSEGSDLMSDADNTLEPHSFVTDWREKQLYLLEANPLVKPRFLAIFDEMVENCIID